VFAFFNAGIAVVGTAEARSISMAVVAGAAAGLVVGKPLGILAAAWLATRLKAGALPPGVGWGHVWGAALLGGIGFTMSLFFATLAFGANEALSLSAKIGVLFGSLAAGALGMGTLWRVARMRNRGDPA
jgi:NhaA family Na+:H+ antiporter